MQSSDGKTTMWVRPAERPFVKRVSDWTTRVMETGNWVLTDFLTPREQLLLEQLTKNATLELEFYGGTPFAERRRALLMPGQWYPAEDDFQVIVVCANPIDSVPLSHGSTLGSVLAIGLDRKKIGDILLQNGKAYVFCVREVARFLLNEWHQVGKASISTTLQTEPVNWIPPVVEKVVVSVASLRVDAVVAQSCHWSRGEAQDAITHGRVFLNFVEVTKLDTEVAVGDLLSVRGFGRVQVLNYIGKSKKERDRIEVGINRSQTSPYKGNS